MSEQPKRADVDVLKGLLGPERPELGCEQCFEALDRYVELELNGADPDAGVPGMRAHLDGCRACDEDHRSLRALIEAEMARPGDWLGHGHASASPPGPMEWAARKRKTRRRSIANNQDLPKGDDL
jgi:anti-sigma factor RsiW